MNNSWFYIIRNFIYIINMIHLTGKYNYENSVYNNYLDTGDNYQNIYIHMKTLKISFIE